MDDDDYLTAEEYKRVSEIKNNYEELLKKDQHIIIRQVVTDEDIENCVIKNCINTKNDKQLDLCVYTNYRNTCAGASGIPMYNLNRVDKENNPDKKKLTIYI